MLSHAITFTRHHPLTGEDYWKKPGSFRQMRFADVEEVVWAITPAAMGNGFGIFPVENHLTPAGQAAFAASRHAERLHARTLPEVREVLADWCQDTSRAFTEMRYAWQNAEPDTEALAAPYRIARRAPGHYHALRNDPRGWVWTIDSVGAPVRSGSAVIAEAVRFTRAEGATFSGWVVSSRGGLHYSDPIRLQADALQQLHLTAQDELAPRH